MGTAQLLTLMACLAGAPPAVVEADAGPASAGVTLSTSGAERPSAAVLLGVGAGAAALSAPASLALGAWVGTLSRNLVLAALPALGLVAVLPPLAVTFAMFYAAELLQPGSGRITPGVFVAVGVQVALLVGAVLLGAQAQDFGDAALFSLAQVVALPLAVYPFILAKSSPLPLEARAEDLSRPRPMPLVSLPVASWRF